MKKIPPSLIIFSLLHSFFYISNFPPTLSLSSPPSTGGVVPIVAADLHRDNLQKVTNLALERSGLQIEDIDVVAVTVGPGLALCLWAGLDFAKSLAHTNRYGTVTRYLYHVLIGIKIVAII